MEEHPYTIHMYYVVDKHKITSSKARGYLLFDGHSSIQVPVSTVGYLYSSSIHVHLQCPGSLGYLSSAKRVCWFRKRIPTLG